MFSWLLKRFAFILLCAAAGYLAAGASGYAGPVIGAVLACAAVLIEAALLQTSARSLLNALAGGLAGCLSALTVIMVFRFSFSDSTVVPASSSGLDINLAVVKAFLIIGMTYLGGQLGLRKANDLWRPKTFSLQSGGAAQQENHKILDTSTIIDGRIADVCETGFIDGPLVVPKFVLSEMQLIADSQDSLKRTRGRRGFEMLERLKKSNVVVIISDADYPSSRDVDSKLMEFARDLNATVITNDYNLNKVAKLRGIRILNINDLANALKPVVLPGETMRVRIVKEGTEHSQGVAYLDDGTMVVVDNARNQIGNTVAIGVTSVLQTAMGKMIFGKIDEQENAQKRDKTAR